MISPVAVVGEGENFCFLVGGGEGDILSLCCGELEMWCKKCDCG